MTKAAAILESVCQSNKQACAATGLVGYRSSGATGLVQLHV